MAIGKIKSEADLDRFIQERLESIPLTAVDGLSDQLAERGRTRGALVEAFIPEGTTTSELVEVAHGLNDLPVSVDLVPFIGVGGSVFSCRLVGLDETTMKFVVNRNEPAGAGGIAVNVLWGVTGGNSG